MTTRKEIDNQIEWLNTKGFGLVLSVYRPDGKPRYQVQHLVDSQVHATWPAHGHTKSIAEIGAYLDGLEFTPKPAPLERLIGQAAAADVTEGDERDIIAKYGTPEQKKAYGIN